MELRAGRNMSKTFWPRMAGHSGSSSPIDSDSLKNFTLPSKRMKHAISALFALVWLFTPSARAESEYDVKAAFLFKFTKFVEWPDAAFAGPDSPFVIGIVGHD